MARTMNKQGLADLRKRLMERLARGDDACDLYEEAAEVRAGFIREMEALLSIVATERREMLHRSENRRFSELRADIDALDPLLAQLRDAALRQEGRHPDQLAAIRAERQAEADAARAAHPEGVTNVTNTRLSVRSEESTYRPDGDVSYFRDLMNRARGDADASARLARHGEEMRSFTGEFRAAGRDTAGDFTPPVWLLNRYVNLARPGRVTADLCEVVALPPGQAQVLIPRITTGSLVANQTADNASLSSRDVATDHITAPVDTYGGVTSVSMQMLDLSPIQFDQVVFADLIKEHARAIGAAVLTGSGTNQAFEGLLTNTSTSTVTYTSTSPTAAGLYAKIGLAAQTVATNIYEPPTAIVMHPRRWAWLASQVDTAGRPIVTPVVDGNQSVNSMSTTEGMTYGGPLGSIMGMPVYIDANVPTNRGASTNEDVILVAKFDESTLYETGPKAQAFFEPGASTGTVLFRVFSYAAFTGAQRRPKAISVIGGTALSTVLS